MKSVKAIMHVFIIVLLVTSFANAMEHPDFSSYKIVVYTPITDVISGALRDVIGIDITSSNVRIRSSVSGNYVTADDLDWADILIIGELNSISDSDGLDSTIIGEGITGRIIITGHDADQHASTELGAERFLSQAISFVLNGTGTGLLAMDDHSTKYDWLPLSWGVSAEGDYWGWDTIYQITEYGEDSGIFDQITIADLSDWDASYHNDFSSSTNCALVPLEYGGLDGTDLVTIGTPGNVMERVILDMQDYSNTLFSSFFNGKLFDLRIEENLSGNISTVYTGENLSLGSGSVWELEAYNNDLYIGMGSELYKADVAANGVTVTLPDPAIWEAPENNEEIISMLTTTSGLVMGTGVEASTDNNGYDTYTGDVYVYDVGLPVSEINPLNITTSVIISAGIECLLESDLLKPKSSLFDLQVSLDWIESIGVVSPVDVDADNIRYKITYDVGGETDAQNVIITAHLPEGVDFVSATHGGEYFGEDGSHYVMWNVGTLLSDADNLSDPFMVDVKVNQNSMPGTDLRVDCYAESDSFCNHEFVKAPHVDCWAGEIVYVRKPDIGEERPAQNGASWETAFSSLTAALTYIENSTCTNYSAVWVAGGEYTTNDTFSLIGDIAVYGGFAGTEDNLYERDLRSTDNQTVLLGATGCNYVVTADYEISAAPDETILSSVTIQGGVEGGIYCDGTSPTIQKCRIQNNLYGIKSDDTATTGNAPIVKNCVIKNNSSDGILLANANAVIRNNTIINNTSLGVNCSSGNQAVELNILWGNNSGGDGSQLNVNCVPGYCCVQNLSDPVGTNIVTDPLLDATCHLSVDSPCIDSSSVESYNDSSTSEEEIDIDGEKRKVGLIDIGADEYPPIRVSAGPDIFDVISVGATTVDVYVEESSIEFIGQATQQMSSFSLLWTPIQLTGQPNPDNTVTMINADSLYPTFILSEAGWYLFKVEAKDGDTVMGGDLLYIFAGAEIALSYEPEDVKVYDTITMTATLPAGSGAAYVKWYGPEGVQFSETTSDVLSDIATTEITFPAEVAKYQIMAEAYKSDGYYLGRQNIWVLVNGQQVSINAGPDQTINWPVNNVQLNGSVSGNVNDGDGNPLVRYEWLAPEGAEGLVHFDNDNYESLQTGVTFDTWGTFELTLVMYGKYGSPDENTPYAYDTVVITVKSPVEEPVSADVKIDTEIVEQTASEIVLDLNGVISWINAPLDSQSYKWVFPEDLSGDPVADPSYIADAGLLNSNSLSGRIAFKKPGDYQITLAAYFKDGSKDHIVGKCTLNVEVILSTQNPVIVDAGNDQIITRYPSIDQVSLHGTVISGSYDSLEWRLPPEAVSGGYISFIGSSTSNDTVIEFKAPGIYPIAFTAKNSNGDVIGWDTVTITVDPPYISQIIVDAGEDQIIPWLGTQTSVLAFLTGSIQDPAGLVTSYEWDYDSAAVDLLDIDNEFSLSTKVEFKDTEVGSPTYGDAIPGFYDFALLAKIGDDVVAYDVVRVTITWDPVTVDAGPDQEVIAGTEFNLSGTITGADTDWDAIEWIDPSAGSGGVTFDPSDSQTTTVTINNPGTYGISLIVKNGGTIVASDVVTITVKEVIVDAGPDQTITDFPSTSQAALHGKVVQRNCDRITWKLPSNAVPNHISFGEIAGDTLSGEKDTWVQFHTVGVYPITLIAENETSPGSGTYEMVGWDTLTITVLSPPHPEITADVKIDAKIIQQMGSSVVVELDGVIDDNPDGSFTSYEWVLPEDLSGTSYSPHSITALSGNIITFTETGEYPISLIAYYNDGDQDHIIGSCMVTLEVLVNGQDAVKASVRQGTDPDYTYHDPYEVDTPVPANTITLYGDIDGGVTWDYCKWIDPTGNLTFANLNAAQTTITSPMPDDVIHTREYKIGFIVKNGGADGTVVGYDTVTIHAYGSNYKKFTVDVQPEELDVVLSSDGMARVQLQGVVDDGDSTSWDTAIWIDPSNGNISFSNNPVDYTIETFITTATISVPGVYPIQLLVKDGSENIKGSDTTIVTVTVPNLFVEAKVFAKNGEAYPVESQPDDDTFTYMIDESLTLEATIQGGLADGLEWVCDSDFVDITNPYAAKTNVSFNRTGTYYIRLLAKSGETIVGGDAVKVVVKPPQMILSAGEFFNPDIDVKEEVFGFLSTTTPHIASFTLSAETNGQIPAGVNYEWIAPSSSGNDVTFDCPSANPQISLSSTEPHVGFTIEAGGGFARYQMKIRAFDDKGTGDTSDDVTLATDTIWVSVSDGHPIVIPGSNYPTVAPGQSLILDKAAIWDDEPFDEDDQNVVWWEPSTDPTIHFDDAASGINQTVRFDNEGLYFLQLCYDPAGLKGTGSIYYPNDTTILVKTPDYYVTAGSPKTVKAGEFVELVDAFVVPQEEAVSYRWTTNAPKDVIVMFEPSANVLNPRVSFSTPDTYTLTLTVNEGQSPFEEPATTTIEVVPNPIEDREAPTVTISDPPSIDEYKVYTFDVRATDDRYINQLTLKLISDVDDYTEYLTFDSIMINSGTAESPGDLTHIYKLDIHDLPATAENETCTLKAFAFDGAGKSDIATLPLTVNCEIHEFKVDPYLVETQDQVAFSAIVDDQVTQWSLQIFDSENDPQTPVYNQTGNLTGYQVNVSGLSDGHYIAVLTLNTDQAKAEFDIARGGGNDIENILRALLSYVETESGNIYLQTAKDEELNIPESPIPVITSGQFTLFGQACYRTDVDGVTYTLELIGDGVHENLTPVNAKKAGSWGVDGVLGNIDMTSYENGMYQFKLTVDCGNIGPVVDTVNFVLDCPLKLGQVKFSQEDLVVNVGNYPLRIVRSYNSFKRNDSGDFGFGWDLSIANMDVKVVKSTDSSRDVELTLPDGTRTTFSSYLDPVSRSSYNAEEWKLEYDIPANLGISDFAEYPSETLYYTFGTGYSGFLWDSDSINVSVYDDLPYPFADIHDPAGFVLTMEDETIFTIQRKVEIKSIKASGLYGDLFETEYRACGDPYLASIDFPTGEKLEFAVNEGSSVSDKPKLTGFTLKDSTTNQNPLKSVEIFRDNANRIIAVFAPSEAEYISSTDHSSNPLGYRDAETPTIKYFYSGGYLSRIEKLKDKGNPSILVTDDEYEVVAKCTYENGYLTDIKDARGLSPIRYLYDDSGKLIGTMDAKGNVIEISHALKDVNGDEYEKIMDRGGNETRHFYNERGNVVLTQQFDGLADDGGILKSQTEYGYGTITATYGSYTIETLSNSYLDSPSMVQDPTGNTTYYQYDSSGRPIKTIDPELNITENGYNPDNGNLLSTMQYYIPDPAAPATTTFISKTVNTYNNDNNLLETVKVFSDAAETDCVSWTVNHYLDNNQVDYVETIDPTNPSTSIIILYNYEVYPVGHLREGQPISGSPDQPYTVSKPFTGTAPTLNNTDYTTFMHYDENNRQDARWTYADSDSNGSVDTRIVNVNQFDAQGRTIRSLRVVDGYTNPNTADIKSEVLDVIDSLLASGVATILSETTYNKIGKVGYSLSYNRRFDDTASDFKCQGDITFYDYDETGNVVETWSGVFTKTFNKTTGASDFTSPPELLTLSQTLYDKEGRTIVSVGPYVPGEDEPIGTETVYNSLGQVVETREWVNVKIFFEDLRDSEGAVVGCKIASNRVAANAWEGTVGTKPLAWTSDNKTPLIAATLDSATQVGPKSYSRTIYDDAGRVKHSIGMSSTQLDNGVLYYLENPTTYLYDNAGRQIQMVGPEGHVGLEDLTPTTIALYGYTSDDPIVAQQIDYSNFEYDVTPSGNLTGYYLTTTHYAGSRRDYVEDYNGQTHFTYDALGRVTTTEYPATLVEETGTSVATYTHVSYDSLGHKEWETTGSTIHTNVLVGQYADPVPESEKKYYSYDIQGRLITVTPPEPESNAGYPVYDYYYDHAGNMVGIHDPLERLTVFKYDEFGRQTYKYMPFVHGGSIDHDLEFYNQITIPTGQEFEQTDYDEFGNVTQTIDYKGQKTEYEYYTDDDMWSSDTEPVFQGKPGQIKTKWYKHTDTTVGSSEEYFYDIHGRTRQVIQREYNSSGQEITSKTRATDYLYDAEGNLTDIVTPEGTVTYEYNPNTGQKIATYGETISTSYAYDLLGRLDSVSTASETTYYGYDEIGNRASQWIDAADDDFDPVNLTGWEIQTHYSYNHLNRLTELVHEKTQGGEDLSKFTYKLAADGMRKQLTESILQPTTATQETRVIDYTYDFLNRLNTETGASGGNGYSADYDYDLVGNRLSRTVGSGGQTLYTCSPDTSYNEKDQLLQETYSSAACAMRFGDETYYAYSLPSGDFYYQDSSGRKIGQFKAFWMGLPSRVNSAIFYVLMLVIPIAFFWPVFVRQWSRIRGSIDPLASPDLRLWHRMLCVLLAYIFLVGPEAFQHFARAEVQYVNLNTDSWGQSDRTVDYTYDANGSLETKITTLTSSPTTIKEKVVNEYNLQGRLFRVITTTDLSTCDVVEYGYNEQGIRVQSYRYQTAYPYVETAGRTNKETTTYLINPSNHTGYAQVLEETTYDVENPDPASDSPIKQITYTIGDDVLAQTVAEDVSGNWTVYDTEYLLYDGHGSTRQLVKYDSGTSTITVVDTCSYDGYGVLLQDKNNFPSNGGSQRPGYTPPQMTNLLYSGEMFDADSQQYYNRARWYTPLNGRFNRVDPYSGNMQDPQSLHKYAYVHNNPVNSIDPSGLFSITSIAITSSIVGVLSGITTFALTGSVKAGVTAFAIGALVTALTMLAITYSGQIVQFIRSSYRVISQFLKHVGQQIRVGLKIFQRNLQKIINKAKEAVARGWCPYIELPSAPKATGLISWPKLKEKRVGNTIIRRAPGNSKLGFSAGGDAGRLLGLTFYPKSGVSHVSLPFTPKVFRIDYLDFRGGGVGSFGLHIHVLDWQVYSKQIGDGHLPFGSLFNTRFYSNFL